MTLCRVVHNKNNPYLVINTTITKEYEMSWRAKGLWFYAFSLPNDWEFRLEDLQQKGKEGRDAVKIALRELEQFGYLYRKPKRNEKGEVLGWEWYFFETPKNAEQVQESLGLSELPKLKKFHRQTENPSDGFPVRRPIYRELSNKKKKETKKKSEKNQILKSSDALVISDYLFSLIKKNDEGIKKCTATINVWAKHIDKIITIDQRQPEEIRQVIDFGMGHHFWCTQINDGKKLRKNFNNAAMAMKAPPVMNDLRKVRKKEVDEYFSANPQAKRGAW